MWLVLAEPEDDAALWAFIGLKKLGLAPIELVTMQELVLARWSHRVCDRGARTEIVLPDERVLDSSSLRGVLNRAVEPGSPVEGEAAEFARCELRALIVSWLASLQASCPVLNPVTASCLCGHSLDQGSWRVTAKRLGMLVSPWSPQDGWAHADELCTAVVLADRVYGDELPDADRVGLATLAKSSETPILQAWFRREAAGYRFVTASPLAELRLGGQDGLEALGRAFDRRGAA